MLVIPVSLFLLGATFIAVYWPARVKPDGGLGFMEGVSHPYNLISKEGNSKTVCEC